MIRPTPLFQANCSARIVCCVLIASLMSMPAQLLAGPLQELRLFHEPLDSVLIDEQHTNPNRPQTDLSESGQSKNQQDAEKPVIKPLDKDSPKAISVATETQSVYQYNGYISTAHSQHYLINGLPLTDIDSLTLVSVKHEGKSLVLKTSAGQVFELSVGQSVNRDSL